MGTLRGDNGGGQPPNGGGLPDLPPEWGTVVIPDDVAELDDEAASIRRDFRREARRNRWRRRFGRPPVYGFPDDDSPALGLPLLIMSIAIIATLTSLFAIAWPARSNRPAQPATHQSTTTTLPDLLLTNSGGQQFRVRESLPAVILLVDGCPCDELVSQTAAAVDAATSVIVIGHAVPTLPAGLPTGRKVIAAADPDGALRAAYPGAGATAILAARDGHVVDAVHEVSTAETFKQYLPGLT